MWLLFQSLIIFAVVASNIRWHWAIGLYTAPLLGWLLALLLTVGLGNLIDLCRSRLARRTRFDGSGYPPQLRSF